MEYIFAWQSKTTISNWGNMFKRKCICWTLFKFGVACIMLLFIAPFPASRTVELLIFIELININLIFCVSNHARFVTGCSFVGTFVLCFGDILLTIYIFFMRNDHRQKYVWYTRGYDVVWKHQRTCHYVLDWIVLQVTNSLQRPFY